MFLQMQKLHQDAGYYGWVWRIWKLYPDTYGCHSLVPTHVPSPLPIPRRLQCGLSTFLCHCLLFIRPQKQLHHPCRTPLLSYHLWRSLWSMARNTPNEHHSPTVSRLWWKTFTLKCILFSSIPTLRILHSANIYSILWTLFLVSSAKLNVCSNGFLTNIRPLLSTWLLLLQLMLRWGLVSSLGLYAESVFKVIFGWICIESVVPVIFNA